MPREGFSVAKAVGDAGVPSGPRFDPADGDIRVDGITSLHQLQAAVQKLTEAFRAAEGRLPSPDDGEYWTAYRALVEDFRANYQPEALTGGPHS